MADERSQEFHVCAYLKPHIRKFIATLLDPKRAHMSPRGYQVAQDLAKMLPLRVVNVDTVEQQSRSLQRINVTVQMSGDRDLDFLASANWNAYAEQLYAQELHSYVLKHSVTRRQGMSVNSALNRFRELYNINEEDLPFDSTKRQWHRLKRQGGWRPTVRGRI